MKFVLVALIIVVVVPLRIWLHLRRRAARAGTASRSTSALFAERLHLERVGSAFGDVGIIAMREVRERARGRIFRVGTALMLAAIGAAIVLPTLSNGTTTTVQKVGVVGVLPAEANELVHAAAKDNDDLVALRPEPTLGASEAALRSGRLDFVIVNADQVLLEQPASASNSPADSGLVQEVADYLGVSKAYRTAGLTAGQVAAISGARPVPVQVLAAGTKAAAQGASIIGLVLLFFMLTQYCTWTLIGVMQEKSSRVVEVLLATVRPIQLLGGKVLGIGLVALGQAALLVCFALGVGAAVGSDVLKGTAPLELGCELLWLVLGYNFYCWVYAAAGSTAERQDQVQTLALPLSIPVLLGYIFSVTVASTGHPDLLFKVLAYLPPTAPFCMSVLVGLNQVTWWQFVISVLLTLAGTMATARFAARVYRRAVLRTGARVGLRELLAR